MSLLYVSNFGDGTISVIDTTKSAVVATYGVGGNPFGLALTPDKKLLFVALFDTGVVRILNADPTLRGTEVGITSVGKSARGVAITPDGSFAYVVGDTFVTMIDTNTFKATQLSGALAGFGQALINPFGVAIYTGGAVGTRIYVADVGNGSGEAQNGGWAVINGSHPQWGTLHPITPEHEGVYDCSDLAVAPDGFVYMVNRGWQSTKPPPGVIILGLPPNITAAREGLVPPPYTGISVGSDTKKASGIAVSSDGTRVYVANYDGNFVAVIDGVTKRWLKNTPSNPASFQNPVGLTLSPDDTQLYVANSAGNNVAIMSTSTLEAIETITVGNSPYYIAM